MLIGLLGSRRELWSRLVLLFLTCGLLAGDHSMLWEFLEHHHHVLYQSNIRPLAHRVDRNGGVVSWRRVEEQRAEGREQRRVRPRTAPIAPYCTYRT